MTDTPRITFDGKQYRLDGEPLPRVTTILGVLAKDGLVDWILRVGKEEADRVRNYGAALGTAVHKAIEAYEAGQPPVLRGPRRIDLAPYLESYQRWRNKHVTDVLASEKLLYHEQHRYAGTCDLIVQLKDGRRALIDFKTSKAPDLTWGLQLSAYKAALEAMGEPVDTCFVLHLPSGDEGYVIRAIEYSRDEHYALAWRACVRLHRFVEEHRLDFRRALGIEVAE